MGRRGHRRLGKPDRWPGVLRISAPRPAPAMRAGVAVPTSKGARAPAPMRRGVQTAQRPVYRRRAQLAPSTAGPTRPLLAVTHARLPMRKAEAGRTRMAPAAAATAQARPLVREEEAARTGMAPTAATTAHAWLLKREAEAARRPAVARKARPMARPARRVMHSAALVAGRNGTLMAR